MRDEIGFSGSYADEDVTFLLQRVDPPLTDIAEKERLLRAGVHYSELLSPEYAPTREYLAAYEQAMAFNGARLGRDVLTLASIVADRCPGPVCLVSLARAGTPIGVLLSRTLVQRFGRKTAHFSISVIAGRGIDEDAIDHIRSLPGISDEHIVFVDGWSAKGVIARALSTSVHCYNETRGSHLDPTLHVITDLCGATPSAATTSDYLIPSCLLGATVSGLVSRSILNESILRRGRFHGCKYYPEWAPMDRSRSFVDAIYEHILRSPLPTTPAPARDIAAQAEQARTSIKAIMSRYGEVREALFKPGIGEATRVLLRRAPRMLLIRSALDEEVQPLRILATEKGVSWQVDAGLPWRAAALIAEAGD